MQSHVSPEHKLFADEIGIEYARWDDFVLKTVVQPVFRRAGDTLDLCGVEAMVLPLRAGHGASARDFLDRLAPAERAAADRLFRLLHVGNYENLDAEGLDLFLNWEVQGDEVGDAAHLAALSRRLAEVGLDPSRLAVEIVGGGAPDQEARLAERLRGEGFVVAIDDFGAGEPDLARMRALAPDIVKIDGARFRRISASPGASHLLCTLVSRLREEGATVLLQGIETREQLEVALETDADLVQGFFLARPALAGAAFDHAPLRVAALFEHTAEVIPLFGPA